MEPLISVIVPVYNVEKYLRECVDSILQQTYKELEIILVDDGSTDKSGKICEEYAKIDGRIHVIHKKNGGLSDTRNTGLSICMGEYIGFVDSDDWIAPDMYENLYRGCVEFLADISCCGRYIVKNGQQIPAFVLPERVAISPKEAIADMLIEKNVDVSPCDKLYSNKFFENVRFPLGEINEDAAIMFNILSCANKIVHVGKAGYYYRKREGSITKSPFSPKKMIVLDHNKAIKEFVINNYPDLEVFADEYCIKNVYQLMMLISGRKAEYPDCYGKIRNEFDSLFYKSIHSRYLTVKDKIAVILLSLGCYENIRRVKKKLFK
jgi:glycosyltransferase involved in cell wall biosynthesis